VNWPFGGLATDNGNNTLHNDTGSYALVISDKTSNIIAYCTMEINSYGVTNLPIILNDPSNSTISAYISGAIQSALTRLNQGLTLQPIDFGAQVVSLAFGRPWWFPNCWYWVAATIGIAWFIRIARKENVPDSME
jgi:hypothetical protein